jgi:uncharacterized protein
MDHADVIRRTADYVRHELCDDSSGHDWWHVCRVRGLAVCLAQQEGADAYVVELAALLHDISDYKLNGGDHDKGPQVAAEWLRSLGESIELARSVSEIISDMSFKGAASESTLSTIEGQVVQDADRLDALGAIGIARAFAFGGYAGQLMHDPARKPENHATEEEYFHRNSTTINHFYEKLLLLKERINTESARQVAERRHAVLERFLTEFMLEWDADDVSEKSCGTATRLDW